METQTKNWREVKLSEVAYINPDSVGKNFPFEQILYTDISSVGSGIAETPTEMSFSEAPSRARRLVKNGDTILSTVRPNRRSFLYIKNPEENRVVSTGFAVLRAGTKIDPRFLYYLISNQSFTDYLTLHAKGAAYPAVDEEIIANARIIIPEFDKQKDIGSILSTYDDLIENNTRRIKILEEIAQAIYRELLVPSASKKWKIVTLRDVIESYTGGGWGKEEPDKDYSGPAFVIRGTDIPHATIGNISTCPLRYHKLSNLRARVLRDGNLVFEVSGGSKGQPVGRSLLITTKLLDQFNQNVICASFCKLIRPDKNKISPFQLHEQILSWYENGVIEKYQVQSTGISNFRFESFIDEEKIALPPEETRKKFDSQLSPLFDEIYSLGSQNQKLCQGRDLLLPKLVTGEIRV